MRVCVLLNAGAGTVVESDLDHEGISDAFCKAGAEVEVHAVPAEKLTESARSLAQTHQIVVAAGGDGTLQSVAQGVIGTPAAFAVLPLGTFNHFAKELEMPLELESAAEAIVHGTPQPYHVPELNGQLFLSFAAISLYARAIRHREAQRRARQRKKPFAMLVSLLQVIRRPPFRRLKLIIGGETIRRCTPSLVVACNEYQLRAMGLLEPFELDRNQLNVCVARAGSRFQVFMMILRGVFGKLITHTEVLTVCKLQVQTHHRNETVVMDGEVSSLQTPLNFNMCDKPLTVIVPPNTLKTKADQSFIART